MVGLLAVAVIALILGMISGFLHSLVLALLIAFLLPGFFIVNPNSSKVLVLFGAYKGTVKDNGFFLGQSLSEQAKDLAQSP